VEVRVTGLNVEVPEDFRASAIEAVTRVAKRYEARPAYLIMELTHQRDPTDPLQLANLQRVTVAGEGPDHDIHAEAEAHDFYTALYAAVAKLESQLGQYNVDAVANLPTDYYTSAAVGRVPSIWPRRRQ
jgi:ribosomal subunit interface protein